MTHPDPGERPSADISAQSSGLIAAKNLRQACASQMNRRAAQQTGELGDFRLAGFSAAGSMRDRESPKEHAVRHVTQKFAEPKPKGVPKVFVDTCRRWGLDEDQQLTLLGYRPNSSVGRLVLQGRKRELSRDVTDRAGYVIAISVGLAILYGESMAAEKRWLRRKRVMLGGESPLDRMLNGDMAALITVNRMVERDRGL